MQRLLVGWIVRFVHRMQELQTLARTGADAGSEHWDVQFEQCVNIRRVLRDGSVTYEECANNYVAQCKIAAIPHSEPNTASARIIDGY